MADVKRELAQGKVVDLIDGTSIRLVYTMYALAAIEDEYGSITEVEKIFRTGTKGKIIRQVAKLIQYAILDDDEREYDLSDPDNQDVLLKLIPLKDMGTVIQLVQEALAEGFQSLQKETAPQAPATAPTTTASPSNSPGARSSTSGARSSAKRAAASGKQRTRKS